MLSFVRGLLELTVTYILLGTLLFALLGFRDEANTFFYYVTTALLLVPALFFFALLMITKDWLQAWIFGYTSGFGNKHLDQFKSSPVIGLIKSQFTGEIW